VDAIFDPHRPYQHLMKNEGLSGYQSESHFSLNGNVVGNVETLSFQVHHSPLLECSDGSSRYRPAVRLFPRQCHPTADRFGKH
jgi:hypothetical protein